MIICLVGPSRAGKTILALQLVDSFGFTHVHESMKLQVNHPPGDVVVDIDGNFPERSRNHRTARQAGARVVHVYRGDDRPESPEMRAGDISFQMPELSSCNTGAEGLRQAAYALYRKVR